MPTLRKLRNRLICIWAITCGRPVAYRLSNARLTFESYEKAAVVECCWTMTAHKQLVLGEATPNQIRSTLGLTPIGWGETLSRELP